MPVEATEERHLLALDQLDLQEQLLAQVAGLSLQQRLDHGRPLEIVRIGTAAGWRTSR